MLARQAALRAMLLQTAEVWHLVQITEADGQITESYPGDPVVSGVGSPDIPRLPCITYSGGKEFIESPVGAAVESDLILYCEAADLRENDKVVLPFGTYRLHALTTGTPDPFGDPIVAAAGTPFVMESGLRKWQ